jgi:hypothetical protein
VIARITGDWSFMLVGMLVGFTFVFWFYLWLVPHCIRSFQRKLALREVDGILSGVATRPGVLVEQMGNETGVWAIRLNNPQIADLFSILSKERFRISAIIDNSRSRISQTIPVGGFYAEFCCCHYPGRCKKKSDDFMTMAIMMMASGKPEALPVFICKKVGNVIGYSQLAFYIPPELLRYTQGNPLKEFRIVFRVERLPAVAIEHRSES